ncbi:LysR family transcriptional regulator [Oricola cellulosilytica]|uniref:LysR family transcriptional regulator n=1 Tax=Oricola cellulosilytica TaxID=1429082 RepID=A0A4R0P9J6_9HYPH|nr:LysR family transcriptional regulator [Oricola cellulosilytica]TCD13508.1 LysR family transcriptional regulator [Oricola cellulosilytica]
MFDWNDIRVFLTVARAGSTLGAARALDMNQTTVSRRIQALERCLDLTLFSRDTRGFHLTEEGEMLLGASEGMENAAADLGAEADRLRRALGGKIRITAAEDILNYSISEIVAEYRAKAPATTFEYVAQDRFLDIEKGEADVAFRAADHLDDATLLCRRVADISWAVYCSRDYAQKHSAPSQADELLNHPVAAYEGKFAMSRASLWFMSQIAGRQVVMTSNTVVNMRAIVLSGVGLGLLPCFSSEPVPELVRCVVVPSENSPHIWMLTTSKAQRSRHLRSFTDFAAERFKTLRCRFELQE